MPLLGKIMGGPATTRRATKFRRLLVAWPHAGASLRLLLKALVAEAHNELRKPPFKARECSFLPFSLEGFRSNTGNIEPEGVICIPPRHPAGHAVFGGDFQGLVGEYRARFVYSVDQRFSADAFRFVFDIYESVSRRVLAEKEVLKSDCPNPVDLHFSCEENSVVEFRVYWDGRSACSLTGVWLFAVNSF